MANTNNGLNQAKFNKNDEFYTRYEDIHNECEWHKEQFKGKIVYCNCDDFRKSNFVKYFKNNFEILGLKKLIATNYNTGDGAYHYTYLGKKDGELVLNLDGDGSFDSPECLKILDKSDIVVTNPPFSLARKHMDLMMKMGKQVLVLGNTNSITFREFFPHIRAGKLWIGASHFNTGMYFYVPDDYEYADTYKFEREKEGKRAIRVASICWYTNMTHSKQHAALPATEKYDPEKYPRYDNYDAIEVSNVFKIPYDYDGFMGVPITFLGKYCADQYEILGCSNAQGECEAHHKGESWNCKIDGKDIYKRLFIRRRKDYKPDNSPFNVLD